MKRLISYAAAALVVIGFCASAGAQGTGQVPDLKGQWVGKGEGIVLGNSPHNPGAASQNRPRMGSIETTLTVEGQEGRRFWGVVSSQHHKEAIIGIVGFDGKSIGMQDTDGATDGTLTDPDTLEITYRHRAPHSTVLAVNRLKRQK